MQKKNFRGYQVSYIDIDANPKLGLYFPFQILIPQNLNIEPELIYACQEIILKIVKVYQI